LRVIAFGLTGRVYARYRVPLTTVHPQAGWHQQNPHQLWEAFCSCIKRVTAALPAAPVAISFSSAMHGLMATTTKGDILLPLLTWADTRAHAKAEELKSSKIGQKIYTETGAPIHAMLPLCKLLYLKQQQVPWYASAQYMSGKDYILYRLTGQFTADYSLASGTAMFSSTQLKWLPEATALAGIKETQLGTLYPSDAFLPNIKPVIATALQLPTDIKLIAGAADGCLASFAQAQHKTDHLTCTLGTSGAIRYLEPNFNAAIANGKLPEQSLFCYPLFKGKWVTGGAVNNAGNLLGWLSKWLPVPDVTLAERSQLIIREATTVAAGANGLMAFPWLFGERAPLWSAATTGALIGLSYEHTPAHLARAILEGMAMNLKQLVELMQQNGSPFNKVIFNGGLSKSAFVAQLLSNIFQLPVHVADQTEASAKGAWLLACKALKLQVQPLTVPPPPERYQPQAAETQFYQQHFAKYLKHYALLSASARKGFK
jgi:gluconokinase